MAPRKRKLSTKRLAECKERLLAEREKLADTLSRIDSKSSGEEYDFGSDDAVDMDDAASDAALETLDRGIDMALEDNLRTRLEEVDTALAKIEKGSYGVCDNCEEDIKVARLELRPWATMCVECAERVERR